MLAGGETAVDDQFGPCNEARFIRGQVERAIGDVLRLAEMADGLQIIIEFATLFGIAKAGDRLL